MLFLFFFLTTCYILPVNADVSKPFLRVKCFNHVSSSLSDVPSSVHLRLFVIGVSSLASGSVIDSDNEQLITLA